MAHEYPHRIRLNGPWLLDRRAGNGAGPIHVTMPAARETLVRDGAERRIRLRRKFGAPTQVDDFERVWLVVEGLATPAQLSLNGNDLGEHIESVAFDVTERLRARNELVVEMDSRGPPGDVWSGIALEIRRTAYLRDVRWSNGNDGRLRVMGNVIGYADGPLEVYLLVNQRTVAYALVEVAPGGAAIELCSESALEVGRHDVRFDLVQSGVVWYRVDGEVIV
jgi:hypothetical protein